MRCPLHPLLLREEHFDQLSPPCEQGPKLLRDLIRQGTRGGPYRASAKRAKTCASIASVFASWPVALAKSRTCRGLTTATGIPPTASALARGTCNPPVASSTTQAGRRVRTAAPPGWRCPPRYAGSPPAPPRGAPPHPTVLSIY